MPGGRSSGSLWHCRSCCWRRSSAVSRPARSAAFGTSCSPSEFLVGVLVLNALRAPVARDRDRACRAHALGPDQGHDRRVAVMVVAALLVVTVAMHAWLGLVVGEFDTTLTQVFATERPTITGPGGAGERQRKSRGAGQRARSSSGTAPSGSTSSCSGPMRPLDATPFSPTSSSSSAWTRSPETA